MPTLSSFIGIVYGALLLALSVPNAAHAAQGQQQPGTITKKIGKVTLLLDPHRKRQGEGPHVKYKGQFYRAVKAKKGMSVPIGSVIQTGGFGRVRVTFPNGDQITISKSSFFRIGYDKDRGKKVTDLMFGSIRGLVRNKNQKEQLQVKTKTMVMGVRGTDFFVSARDASGSSVVNVLRGKVAVAQLPSQAAEAKPGEVKRQRRLRMVEIPAGFSVKVKPVPKTADRRKRPAPLKVKPTTKKQLIAVQVETVIKEDPNEKVEPEVAERIAKLEAKAAENCLQDIKDYNPALYQRLKEQGGGGSVDAIQTSTVKSMIKKAPVVDDVKNKKPTAKELEAIDQDIYDRYFN